MRTLYESILDDEDVLINNNKELANNPLLWLIDAFENNISDDDILKVVENGLFDEFIKDNFYLDRKKSLNASISKYYRNRNLEFRFSNITQSVIRIEYYEGYDDVFIQYMSKSEINGNYKYTGLDSSDFYKKHSNIGKNLKKLGYKKSKTHSTGCILYEKY